MLPNLSSIVRRSTANLVESKLMPLVVFVITLEIVGQTTAVLAALTWAVGCLVYRLATGRRIPGLVILAVLALSARTVAALLSGSMFVYFLQPTVSTALVACALGVSLWFEQPLVAKLAHDLVPFDEETSSHPHLRLFFARLTVVWTITSFLNAAITVWLLLTQSTTTFVVVKSLLGPATSLFTLGLGTFWFWFTARPKGIRVQFGPRPAAISGAPLGEVATAAAA